MHRRHQFLGWKSVLRLDSKPSRPFRARVEPLEDRLALAAAAAALTELSPGPLNIPFDGSVVSTGLTLPAGTPYTFVATGSIGITDPNVSGGITFQADAEFEWDPTTNNPIQTSAAGVDLGVNATTSDGVGFTDIDWGATYSPTHQYTGTLISDGKPLDLKFFDTFYPDNHPGSLSVDIFGPPAGNPGGGGTGGSGDGPRVTSVLRYGIHMMPTTLVLSFDQALDPTRAQDVRNYTIIDPHGHRVAIRSAVYDPATHTVTLHPARRLNFHYGYKLTVNGENPNGLTDTQGLLLDGKNTGQPGSDFFTVVNRHNLVFPTIQAKHHAVTSTSKPSTAVKATAHAIPPRVSPSTPAHALSMRKPPHVKG